MKHNSLRLRIFTVSIIMLIAGAITAILAGGQQVVSIQAPFHVPSGPVSRDLLFAKTAPAPFFSDPLEGTRGTFQRIDACVQTVMRVANIPGASIAIIDNGSLVYQKGYGVKHREQGGDVTPGTVFRFGSTLKMMTAAAVLQQVERGLVDLQAPITRYIPRFKFQGHGPQHHQDCGTSLTPR
jgi:D-alanyl-D-alanine carboxypeptidase